MDTFIVVTTVSTLLIGGVTIWQTNRSSRVAIRARYDERQSDLRTDVRRKLNNQHRLVRAVNNLQHGLPGSPVEEDLEQLAYDLDVLKRHLVAPSPAHFDVVIKSIDDAVAKLAVAHHAPRNDTVFLTHIDLIKANVLRPWLERALDNIKVLHDGLVEIERQPMSRRKQLKLFKALEPKNQTPIEE